MDPSKFLKEITQLDGEFQQKAGNYYKNRNLRTGNIVTETENSINGFKIKLDTPKEKIRE